MASSEYLSSKSEGREDAFKSATYTGIAYLVTVALLILPYLLFDEAHYLWAMATMIVIVLLILVVFNYYISVAQDLLPFRSASPDGRHQPGRGRALVRHRYPGEAVPGRGHLGKGTVPFAPRGVPSSNQLRVGFSTQGGVLAPRRPYPATPPSAHAKMTARSSSGVEMGCTSNSRTSTSSTPGDTNAGSVGPR